ncbi:MAG: hypothetical protein RLZZ244_978 [Verrucomicrobiota bacterium]|jgi:uncharacterized protein YbbC (DUF1343 family)
MAIRLLLTLLLFLSAAPARALTLGVDRLESMGFEPLRGKRVGLITNHTGVNSKGRKTREVLSLARGVRLVSLFSPEHGIDGTELAGRYVPNRKDPLTGLLVHSLYGPTRKPTPEMLKGLDVLVFDMQDIGVRSYTYISTMARCMEAAGEAGLEFMVLDRPNPLGGLRVEGPPVETEWISFVGQLPVPYVHGMTCGELARMLNERQWMASRCKLKVVTMEGWDRSMLWGDTGLRWVKTSPNIPRPDSPAYYVATGIVGSLTGSEVGVGGPLPFQICAAKGLNPQALADFVQSLRLDGVRATPYAEGGFSGCRLQVDPAAKSNLSFLALALLSEVNRRSAPDLFAKSSKDKLDIFFKVYGSQSIQNQLRQGTPIRKIAEGWQPGVDRFRRERAGYLFY